MIREDLGGDQISEWRPVTAYERAAWYGHRPGIFLLPNRASLTERVEHALFKNGFATITLDGDQLPDMFLSSLFTSVWSAGLVVLLIGDKFSPDLQKALDRIAGESLLNFRGDSDQVSDEEIVSDILSRAASLRVGGPFDNSDKEATNA
jgi:hypothetical protein